MDPRLLIDGLILYLGLLVLLTFHEFGHAWMAWKCGDDTAHLQGRVSLNPLVHIDPIGTVVVPLLLIFMAPGGFFAGWAVVGLVGLTQAAGSPVSLQSMNTKPKARACGVLAAVM